MEDQNKIETYVKNLTDSDFNLKLENFFSGLKNRTFTDKDFYISFFEEEFEENELFKETDEFINPDIKNLINRNIESYLK